jgi:thiamine-phosphate pyrophosphorylase
MITDRRRFAGDAERRLVERVAEAAASGVNLVQVRERDLDARALLQLVARCVDATKGTRTRVLVNDRLDVALAAGAHGVHLRGDSMPASRVRTLSPAGFLIGRSVHSREEVLASVATGVDYLVFGAVFPTASKPGFTGSGVRALADVVMATTVPVLAVGGVTIATVSQLARSGAAGFAAIDFFAHEDGHRLRSDLIAASLAFGRG